MHRAKKRSFTRYNPKTGRMQPKNRKRMMAAMRGARKRRGKRQSTATKMKRRRSLMKTIRSGRTKFGRKVRKHKHH